MDRRLKSREGLSLTDYVTDRPYAASSMLAVALGRVFNTALNGRSDSYPELAASALVVGAGLAHAFERRFGPHPEEEAEFVRAFDVQDLAPERPPTGLVRVAAAERAPTGWRAWSGSAGRR